MYSTIITPICTETPNSASIPTPEDTLKCVFDSSSARIPPMGAITMFTMISSPHLNELNAEYRIRKIASTVMGTIPASRALARRALSYSPVQSMRYPSGSLTFRCTARMASLTVPPKSRPRTLYLMAM